MKETIINIENLINREQSDIMDNEPKIENNLEINDKYIPKRVLAYTTIYILQQLGNKFKSSVDGTFKTSYSFQGQKFLWMIKTKGYGYLQCGGVPDKAITNYKGILQKIKSAKFQILSQNKRPPCPSAIIGILF